MILLKKLNHYGIRGTPAAWLKNFLYNRKMYVQIGSETSHISDIVIGVPQGSILGPWLFNVYVNDFYRCLKYSNCIMYADDTTIFIKGESCQETVKLLNLDLSYANSWFICNKLSLNVSKSSVIMFHPKQKIVNNVGDFNISFGWNIS